MDLQTIGGEVSSSSCRHHLEYESQSSGTRHDPRVALKQKGGCMWEEHGGKGHLKVKNDSNVQKERK